MQQGTCNKNILFPRINETVFNGADNFEISFSIETSSKAFSTYTRIAPSHIVDFSLLLYYRSPTQVDDTKTSVAYKIRFEFPY